MDGGDRIAATLARHGVRTLFTLCGGHISPILAAAKRAGIRVVDVRDEAAAVFAADATARLTGVPGVAAVTAGPGVTNSVTALANARLAQSPVVLIGGGAPTILSGRGALQDIEQVPSVRPHVKWTGRAHRVRDLTPLLEAAIAAAVRGVPGPVFVECPVDLLYDERIVRSWYDAGTKTPASLRARLERWYVRRHLNRLFDAAAERPSGRAAAERGLSARDNARVAAPPSPPVPAARDTARTAAPPSSAIRAAAALLSRADRPVLLVGSQAVIRAAQVEAIAGAVSGLGIPVYLSGMARGLLGRSHPLQLRHARRQALRETDLVILAGVPCDFRLDYGRHISHSARVVAANRSAAEARRNRRPDVLAVGDAGAFLEALALQVTPRPAWQGWLGALRQRDADRETEMRRQAAEPGDHVNPLALLAEVDRLAADDAVFVLDGGDFAATASYVVRARGPLRHLDPGVFGTLGVGGGFALGAKLARPDSEVWILYGDGAAGYSLAELDTCVRHGLPVIAVVGNDASWEQIGREQREILGDDVGTVLRRSDYHVVAQGYGAVGILVRRNEEIRPALERARAEARGGRPVLINAWLARTEFRKGSISM
jgi:acetolactate synthase-1/2/3 large subunit